MAARCASCGSENAEGARFCSSCGSPLADEGAVARRERKFATALFADIVGSTSLAEREDPEIVQSLVGRAFDRLAQEVERYGGLLEKFMGDAVLAVFGVPAAHEDDPERAVRAALEMQAVLSELNRGFATEGKPRLAMRIGVEGGQVLVDLERAAGPRDRMLTGDAVNTAARLQAVAEPGHAVVGPTVYAATKDVIDYEELEPLELKGKAELVPVWDALRVKARRRGERAPLGLEARLVGRDEELGLLKQTLHRVESESRPALVTVLGPAGVGKSRLAWELTKYMEGLPQFFYWRRGRCLAYGNVSYSALADAVKAQCEILEDDPPEAAERKVERAVVDLFGDDSVVPHVRALVGAGADRAFGREELFDAWRRFLERMAARYPLGLVLEDIHWADDGLLDFLDHLADWGQGPIFVLAMARPELLEVRPGWGGGKRNYAAIYLEPLTPEENRAMLEDLLPAALPDQLEELVVERSEGNPLFTEEIVRMLIDRGVLRATEGARWEIARPVDEVDVPRSIQALIAARIDSLPADEKTVLQDAAVVGRIFWIGAVARLSGEGQAAVRDALGRLRVKEILVPREPPVFSGELEFAFRHVLIRDGAYDSLPKSLRASKHAEVAAWAEERAGERREEVAELIATHHVEALRYLDELGETGGPRRELEAKACHWSRAAGDRAWRLWQQGEAVRWYRRALDLSGPTGMSPAELATLWEAYARASSGAEPLEEVRGAYETALGLYDELGLGADAGRVETQLAGVAFGTGRDEEVVPHFERALALLEPLGDSRDLADAFGSLGWYHWRRGRVEEAEGPLRRSIEIADRVGHLVGKGQALHTLGLLLIQHTERWREGLPLVEESYRIAREAGDLLLLLRVSNNLPSVLLEYAPQRERGEAILREGLELARRAGQREMEGWILGTLSYYMATLGRLVEAEECATAALEAARAVANTPLVGQLLGGLAYVKLARGARGALDEAEPILEEAMGILRENPEPQADVWIPVVEADLARARGDASGALACLVEAVEQVGPNLNVGGGELLLAETVRGLVMAGRAGAAAPHLDRLREVAAGRPHAEAFGRWAEGFAAADPAEGAEALRDAAARLESLGRRIDHARCLLDLGRVERRLEQDPRPTLERAREILADCGAGLYLREAEAALEEAST
ncbi:MAG: AAA family ATPase [Actinobacteria bacterium]|nr:AAA family ATPase [Actinomycetota bacterium]